jgi:hypothetical protein
MLTPGEGSKQTAKSSMGPAAAAARLTQPASRKRAALATPPDQRPITQTNVKMPPSLSSAYQIHAAHSSLQPADALQRPRPEALSSTSTTLMGGPPQALSISIDLPNSTQFEPAGDPGSTEPEMLQVVEFWLQDAGTGLLEPPRQQ